MYDHNILSVTGPAIVATLPSTGSDLTIQLAISAAIGMIVWGLVYSLSAKAQA